MNFAMIPGRKPSSYHQAAFTSPETGELKVILFQFLKMMVEGQVEEKQKAYWL